MKNYIAIVLLIGLATVAMNAFDENATDPWVETPRERKVRRADEKHYLEWHRERSLDPKAPSNIKLWNFKKLQNEPYHMWDYGVGVEHGDKEYFYQKPGIDKQGKPYPRYTLAPNASKAAIAVEADRRFAYEEKQRQKFNYWTKGVIGRWFHRNYAWARR
jgi:hypothetical protein